MDFNPFFELEPFKQRLVKCRVYKIEKLFKLHVLKLEYAYF